MIAASRPSRIHTPCSTQSHPSAFPMVVIVVGVWNSDNRRAEHMPEKALVGPEAAPALAHFLEWSGLHPTSDLYLKFLVEELKPVMDATYRTLPGQSDTFVMGRAWAGCLSTHWPAGENRLVDYMGAHLPKAGAHRQYFDFGTTTLDWNYEPFQRRMDEHLRAAGYRESVDWMLLLHGLSDGVKHTAIRFRHSPANDDQTGIEQVDEAGQRAADMAASIHEPVARWTLHDPLVPDHPQAPCG